MRYAPTLHRRPPGSRPRLRLLQGGKGRASRLARTSSGASDSRGGRQDGTLGIAHDRVFLVAWIQTTPYRARDRPEGSLVVEYDKEGVAQHAVFHPFEGPPTPSTLVEVHEIRTSAAGIEIVDVDGERLTFEFFLDGEEHVRDEDCEVVPYAPPVSSASMADDNDDPWWLRDEL